MDAVIVSGLRTPIAARNGALSGWHAADLLGEVLKHSVPPSPHGSVDAVIAGCATPIGEQALNVARNAVLAAGLAHSIPAMTVDGHAASGAHAFLTSVAMVSAGLARTAVAAGVESMTRVPSGASAGVAVGKPFGPAVHERYAEEGGLVPPGAIAERLASRYRLSRNALDEYVLQSRERTSGARRRHLLALPVRNDKGVASGTFIESDELTGNDLDPAAFEPAFESGGVTTAANFAKPADGAAALVVASRSAVRESDAKPLTEVVACVSRGVDTVNGSEGSDVARRALDEAGCSLEGLTAVVVHEGSSAAVLSFAAEMEVTPDRINPWGGCLASGEPLGAIVAMELLELSAYLQEEGGLGLYVLGGPYESAAVVLRGQ